MVKVHTETETAHERCLHFSVSDTGIGIAEEKQAVIVEAFAQVDGSTTRNYGGTGLGLAIASRLIAQMRGKVWIESVPGEGTTFHFTGWFGSKPAEPKRIAALPDAAAVATGAKQSLRILLVEDNLINRAVATAVLKKGGHTLVQAANGNEAVDAAAREPFDIIFMDVQLPGMDGFDATRSIRRMEKVTGRRTTIVAMTAHAMIGDRERCLASGMDGYLSKPLERAALTEVLDRASHASVFTVLGEVSAGALRAPSHGTADEVGAALATDRSTAGTLV
jgi:CheY-like chemotaxis protein